jgi:4-amino-4-deoxy-L-arabinose transferase-like glycosyltransferase
VPASAAARPAFAWRPVGLVAVAVAALLAATITRYGYHRDELYFRLLGEHPSWGYVDQPPATPLMARAAIEVFGDSVWALRTPALLCVVGTAFIAALIAREFGSGGGGQTLAAAGVASAFPLVVGHVLQTASLDLVVWAAFVLFAVRALRGSPRWWLAAGAVVGLGLYNKLLVVLLLIGLGVGILAVGPRSVLRSGWLWAGVALALVLGAPNVVYQVVNDFPQSKMASALAENKGDEARATFVPFQFLLLGLALAPVWIAGLVAIWRDRAVRAFAVAYPVICVLLLILAGQPYYTTGLLVAMYAAGCGPALAWVGRGSAGRRWLLGAGLALNVVISAVVALPLLPVRAFGDTFIPEANQAARDTVGWPTYVRQVADVYGRLAPAERAATVILTGNYGEAGAIDRYGAAYGLPAVYSGQNELYNLGPPPESALHVVFVLQAPIDWFATAFASCTREAKLDNGVGVANEENEEAVVYVCRNRLVSWADLWPRVQHYD